MNWCVGGVYVHVSISSSKEAERSLLLEHLGEHLRIFTCISALQAKLAIKNEQVTRDNKDRERGSRSQRPSRGAADIWQGSIPVLFRAIMSSGGPRYRILGSATHCERLAWKICHVRAERTRHKRCISVNHTADKPPINPPVH